MSKLQTALHAMPPGTIVTKDLMRSTRALNERLSAVAQEEVLAAKRLQNETGCSWGDAIRSVRPVDWPAI